VNVLETRKCHGALQVTPVRNWGFCHIRLRVATPRLLLVLPRTVPIGDQHDTILGRINKSGPNISVIKTPSRLQSPCHYRGGRNKGEFNDTS
jgi:hypothetical protein